MAEYQINKGVGRQVEFKGLTSQYLFLFVGGLAGVFLLFVIMYMSGVSQTVCILFAIFAGTGIVWGTFYLNRAFGPHGLMKLWASKRHPRRIIHRRAVRYLISKR
ncbi:DUF4133 domain-containing protein [Alistipes senegalensis]|uniref:DUF4133 domain-containing protein n=1 Tax=Alistipes senegalensis TaxID=1288121 RepID=UPI0018AAD7A6|nr:DUF4133 domain-containing protein [Alistipes senegalensis]